MNEDTLLERIMEAQDMQNNVPRGPFKYKKGEPGYGPEICVNCEDAEIPTARREYGFSTCAPCAQYLEQRKNSCR